MIGVTISSPKFRHLAVEAQKRFEEATGLPSVLVSTPVEKNYLLKFELFDMLKGQTVVFFDSDLWFIQKCDLSVFNECEEFLAVQDPGIAEESCFPIHDSKVLGIDIQTYFNSGFMIWNDRHEEVFRQAPTIYHKFKKQLFDFGEQSVLNAAVSKFANLRLISHSFNYTPVAEFHNSKTMKPIEMPLTIHAAGYVPEQKFEALNYFVLKYQRKYH